VQKEYILIPCEFLEILLDEYILIQHQKKRFGAKGMLTSETVV